MEFYAQKDELQMLDGSNHYPGNADMALVALEPVIARLRHRKPSRRLCVYT
ncbi:MAG: hypothetical protein M3N13_03740 [Candidatus Eremiobacteraeota bacterium]|nr:hypothetical protein [Candidatus Eremiobacteraeota bacterium]